MAARPRAARQRATGHREAFQVERFRRPGRYSCGPARSFGLGFLAATGRDHPDGRSGASPRGGLKRHPCLKAAGLAAAMLLSPSAPRPPRRGSRSPRCDPRQPQAKPAPAQPPAPSPARSPDTNSGAAPGGRRGLPRQARRERRRGRARAGSARALARLHAARRRCRMSAIHLASGASLDLPGKPILNCEFALVFTDYARNLLAPLARLDARLARGRARHRHLL